MMTMTLDTRGFADLKPRSSPSSKLAEILSAGLGYGTHAALLADMRSVAWIEREVHDAMAAQRAGALGIAPPAGLMTALEAMEPDGPVSLTAADVRDIIRLAEACNREEAEKMRNLDGSGFYSADQLAAVGLLEPSNARDALERRIAALTKPASRYARHFRTGVSVDEADRSAAPCAEAGHWGRLRRGGGYGDVVAP